MACCLAMRPRGRSCLIDLLFILVFNNVQGNTNKEIFQERPLGLILFCYGGRTIDKLVKPKNDEHYMRIALDEARKAYRKDEVPIGAVLVSEGEILALAHNMPIALNDPTAHAEILVLREASLKKGNYRLPNTILYVTVEPCLMCLGALLQARVCMLVFGAFDPKAGACGSLHDIPSTPGITHRIEVVPGVLEKECREILQDFFKSKRG